MLPYPWGQGTSALFITLTVPVGRTHVQLPTASRPAPASRLVSCTSRALPARWSPELCRHSSEGLTGETETLNSNRKPSNPLIPRAIESRPELFTYAPSHLAI
jgi:hypothetical protein